VPSGGLDRLRAGCSLVALTVLLEQLLQGGGSGLEQQVLALHQGLLVDWIGPPQVVVGWLLDERGGRRGEVAIPLPGARSLAADGQRRVGHGLVVRGCRNGMLPDHQRVVVGDHLGVGVRRRHGRLIVMRDGLGDLRRRRWRRDLGILRWHLRIVGPRPEVGKPGWGPRRLTWVPLRGRVVVLMLLLAADEAA